MTVTIESLGAALEHSWTQETSADPSRWSKKNPAWGQCAITAVIVQDYLGGEIVRAHVPEAGMTHYWNILPDSTIADLAKSQFPEDIDFVDPEVRDRQYVLSFAPTVLRYETLKKSVQAYLEGAPNLEPQEPKTNDSGTPAVLLKNARTGRYYTRAGVCVPSSLSHIVEHVCGHSASHLFRTMLTPGGERGRSLEDEASYYPGESHTEDEQRDAVDQQLAHLRELIEGLELAEQKCPKCLAEAEATEAEEVLREHVSKIPACWQPVVIAPIEGTPGQRNVARRTQVRILEQAALEFDNLFLPEADPFSRAMMLSMLAQAAGVQSSVTDFAPEGKAYHLFVDAMNWILSRRLLSIDNPKTIFSINNGLNQANARAFGTWRARQQFIRTRFGLAESAVQVVLAILYSDGTAQSVRMMFEMVERVAHVTERDAPLDALLRASEEVRVCLESGEDMQDALSPYVHNEPTYHVSEWQQDELFER